MDDKHKHTELLCPEAAAGLRGICVKPGIALVTFSWGEEASDLELLTAH